MEDRKIRVRKEEIGNGEEKYLGGKASYKRVVDKFIGERLVLCNNIVEIDENNYEFYQYFIIDISNWDLEYLKECKQRTLQICYSELLDCYVLCVGHCGTSWTYVGSDFDLEVIE